ncbi:MAG: AcrB/AcrD/AcrF family protein [Gammaproteobacteria bacterium]|nr:MAG: AcrB/AcrD/AcrF family protein [Gammaproteobacteria bacterium]
MWRCAGTRWRSWVSHRTRSTAPCRRRTWWQRRGISPSAASAFPLSPTGEFTSEKEFGDLLIRGAGEGSDRLVYLRDVADIVRDYQEPPQNILRYNGQPAIGIGISTVSGGNVVVMGEALKKRFRELKSQLPIGIEGNVISLQSEAVTKAINGFLVNLAEAIAIVVVVLLAFMGLRSGLIIGAILFVTVSGTFIFMSMYGITLERISLGALVIALGMLVDNAIVVTDGMRMRMERGMDALRAAREVVGQTALPLLGATIVAILAFAAIGTSKHNTGEYTRSLFLVILISLLLSWVTAVTSTPLFGKTFLKTGKGGGEDDRDPYEGGFYRLYKSVLRTCINHRWITAGVALALFVTALVGFGSVKQSFFPDSTRPQFYVDFWFAEGTDIEATREQMEKVEQFMRKRQEITAVTTQIGGGSPRFLLTYSPELPNPNFARVIADVKDYKVIPDLARELQTQLEELMPQANVNVRMFVNGPSTGGKIQLRIQGPDPVTLRSLAKQAEAVMDADVAAKTARNEWGNQILVLKPELAETQARRAGLNRPELAAALQAAVEGRSVGVYRERDELLPIIARSPESERIDLDNLGAIQVWSPAAQQMIPVDQVVDEFRAVFENPVIWRRDRENMLKFHLDPRQGLPSELFSRIKPAIEQELKVDVVQYLGKSVPADKYDASTIPLRENDHLPLADRPGYFMAWGGEAEDSRGAKDALNKTMPVFFGVMVLIVLALFNSIRKTLIIWLTVPLAIVGVTLGLLLLNQPFGFMALLGLMSLSGMLIKNAIVLIDEIDVQRSSGKAPYRAIVDAGVSRLIPVSMAAGTTILGMIPLVTDAFFVSMAVTIMFGLGFATFLTLLVVPTLYAIFFGIREEKTAA